MKPSLLAIAIEELIKADVPAMVWGPPGTAKSQIVNQVATKIYAPEYCVTVNARTREITDANGNTLARLPYMRDLRASTLDPTDVRGIPYIDTVNKTANWSIPSFLPQTEAGGILFLDEINLGSPLVQASLYQLILDKQIGDYNLPRKWKIIAAGNNSADRCNVNRMTKALENRLCHLEIEIDSNDWEKHALKTGFELPVILYARFRPANLYAFDPTKQDKAFATLRSWERVSDFLKVNPPDTILYDVIKGLIGDAIAAEFCGFLKIYKNLPNIKSMIANAKTCNLDYDTDVKFALCGALGKQADYTNIGAIVTLADRLGEEFGTLLMVVVSSEKPELRETKSFIEWSIRNQNVTFNN